MTTGEELVEALNSIKPGAEPGFDVLDVASAPGFKIGRDADDSVVLLTPADTSPEPPTQLWRLSLDPSIMLSVRHPDGSTEKGEYGLVRLRLGEAEYLEPFLQVVANLVRVIGSSPGPGEVSIAMRRMVRLFDASPNPRGSVLGLWGELLTICESEAPAELVDAWHASVYDNFDFAASGSRLEVKTTTGTGRRHIFSLEQLLPVPGATVTIVSITTTETAAGTSVEDLISRTKNLLDTDPVRQMRVHEVVAQTLGAEWARHVDHRFDEDQAIQSLRFLPAPAVPRVGEVPDAISGVSFTADCSDVQPESAPHGLAALVRSHGA
ncbi:PD-(D/E)XK motif protein [Aeromicrobium sp. CnD17-E]|uniref:PD-(D/E)XK motif protein n=1 Tax=Aeromicrobium sp. CnD17-E TaxID=2954487 RepID=UPI0020984C47|nr:PD-(D/E)XK motif protein [Aeromicrobium sp. CnD17-E]MCO7237919.1 PD-(D/E)XK motif protein [Aeromicrobium sp. CnD17-E]